jgi:hypothetical protein
MSDFMSQTDAFTWAMESDPRLRSTVVTVIMLDRSPDWDVVRERFEVLSGSLPIWRQRVVESPAPAPPRWEDAPDFDFTFHMRRVSAPEPGNLEGVLEMARVAAMSDFDRARPLWTATLIDGLDDGGAAVLCKFHHALTDGVGGIQIAMHLFGMLMTQCACSGLKESGGVPEKTQLWRPDLGSHGRPGGDALLGQPHQVRRLRHAHGRRLAPDECEEHGAPVCEHAGGERVRGLENGDAAHACQMAPSEPQRRAESKMSGRVPAGFARLWIGRSSCVGLRLARVRRAVRRQ